MNSKKMTTALSLALTFVGAGAFAENLVWVGDKQNSWSRDDSLANWTNQEGKVRSFQRYDNAYISDLSATEPSLKMGVSPVYVTDVVFDIQDEFALQYEGGGGFRAGVISSFTKRGPGRLTIQRTSGYNDMACDAVIEAGTLELVGATQSNMPLLGNLQENVAFRVSPGASFVVHEPYHLSRIEAINRSSTPTSGNPPLGGRILLDGGTFVLGQSAVSDVQHTASAVRELALTNGATVRFAGFGDKDNRGNAIFRVADRGVKPLCIRNAYATGAVFIDHAADRELVVEDVYCDFHHTRHWQMCDGFMVPRAPRSPRIWYVYRNATPAIRKTVHAASCVQFCGGCAQPGPDALVNVDLKARMLNNEHFPAANWTFRDSRVWMFGLKSEDAMTYLDFANCTADVAGANFLQWTRYTDKPIVRVQDTRYAIDLCVWSVRHRVAISETLGDRVRDIETKDVSRDLKHSDLLHLRSQELFAGENR